MTLPKGYGLSKEEIINLAWAGYDVENSFLLLITFGINLII